tara:strand:- start:314 stop:1495 length:1182 start_codon:yes stop_codon:yes gene_type:complete
MKKRNVAILGSTGSIGKASLDIFISDKKNFKVILLSAKSNYSLIIKQIKKIKPSYFIINDYDVFQKVSKKFNNSKTKILNNYKNLPIKINFDITISCIVGIAGLEPTIEFIKRSKKILLANKESIICGWHIINNISKKYKTTIVPVDSEHFSIHQLTKNFKNSDLKKIYLTASGGPFLKKPLSSFSKIRVKDAIRHPNWSMGKKISIDSSNLMNKVLEIIEAYKFFPFSIDKYEIIIHPQSLIHAVVIFKNGQVKFLYHETDMKIPIANAIYDNNFDITKIIKSKKQFLKNSTFLNFEKVDKKKFPIVTFLKRKIYNNSSPIILNASNEILVDCFIKGKISFNGIYRYLKLVFNDRDFKKYAIKKTPSIKDIYEIDNWAREKTLELIGDNNEK